MLGVEQTLVFGGLLSTCTSTKLLIGIYISDGFVLSQRYSHDAKRYRVRRTRMAFKYRLNPNVLG